MVDTKLTTENLAKLQKKMGELGLSADIQALILKIQNEKYSDAEMQTLREWMTEHTAQYRQLSEYAVSLETAHQANEFECVPDDSNLECVPVEDEKTLACLPSKNAVAQDGGLVCLPPEGDKETLACLPGDTSLACLPAEKQNMAPELFCKPDPACQSLDAAPVLEGLGIDKSKDIDAQLVNRQDLSPRTMENLKAWAKGDADPQVSNDLRLELEHRKVLEAGSFPNQQDDDSGMTHFAAKLTGEETPGDKTAKIFQDLNNASGTDKLAAYLGDFHNQMEDSKKFTPEELKAFEDNVMAPVTKIHVEACSASAAPAPTDGGGKGGGNVPVGGETCLTPGAKQAMLDDAGKAQGDLEDLMPGKAKVDGDLEKAEADYKEALAAAERARVAAEDAKDKADDFNHTYQDAKAKYEMYQGVANSADDTDICPFPTPPSAPPVSLVCAPKMTTGQPTPDITTGGGKETTETVTNKDGSKTVITTITLPGGETRIVEKTTKESKEVSSKETTTDGQGGSKTIETITLPGGETRIVEKTIKESKEVSSKETVTDGHGGGKTTETIILPGGGTKVTETIIKESKEVSSKEVVNDGHGGSKTIETIILPGGETRITEKTIKENKEVHTIETTHHKDGSSKTVETTTPGESTWSEYFHNLFGGGKDDKPKGGEQCDCPPVQQTCPPAEEVKAPAPQTSLVCAPKQVTETPLEGQVCIPAKLLMTPAPSEGGAGGPGVPAPEVGAPAPGAGGGFGGGASGGLQCMPKPGSGVPGGSAGGSSGGGGSGGSIMCVPIPDEAPKTVPVEPSASIDLMNFNLYGGQIDASIQAVNWNAFDGVVSVSSSYDTFDVIPVNFEPVQEGADIIEVSFNDVTPETLKQAGNNATKLYGFYQAAHAEAQKASDNLEMAKTLSQTTNVVSEEELAQLQANANAKAGEAHKAMVDAKEAATKALAMSDILQSSGGSVKTAQEEAQKLHLAAIEANQKAEEVYKKLAEQKNILPEEDVSALRAEASMKVAEAHKAVEMSKAAVSKLSLMEEQIRVQSKAAPKDDVYHPGQGQTLFGKSEVITSVGLPETLLGQLKALGISDGQIQALNEMTMQGKLTQADVTQFISMVDDKNLSDIQMTQLITVMLEGGTPHIIGETHVAALCTPEGVNIPAEAVKVLGKVDAPLHADGGDAPFDPNAMKLITELLTEQSSGQGTTNEATFRYHETYVGENPTFEGVPTWHGVQHSNPVPQFPHFQEVFEVTQIFPPEEEVDAPQDFFFTVPTLAQPVSNQTFADFAPGDFIVFNQVPDVVGPFNGGDLQDLLAFSRIVNDGTGHVKIEMFGADIGAGNTNPLAHPLVGTITLPNILFTGADDINDYINIINAQANPIIA